MAQLAVGEVSDVEFKKYVIQKVTSVIDFTFAVCHLSNYFSCILALLTILRNWFHSIPSHAAGSGRGSETVLGDRQIFRKRCALRLQDRELSTRSTGIETGPFCGLFATSGSVRSGGCAEC